MIDPERQLPGAATTFNEQWFDALLRHQIHTQRYAGSLRNSLVKLLSATEKDLRRQITRALRGDRRMSPLRRARAERLIARIHKLRTTAWRTAEKQMLAEMRQFATSEAEFYRRSLSALSPVELELIMPAAQTLRTMAINDPFEGLPMKRWVARTRTADLNRIRQQIIVGITQGEPSDVIARRIVGSAAVKGRDGALAATRRNATAVARTAVNHVSNSSRRAFFEANAELFREEIFVATLDGRTTPVCRGYDGQKFPVGDGPYPPLHFQCRSLRVAAVGEEAIGMRPMKPTTERMLVREYSRTHGLGKVTSRASLPRGHKGKYDSFAGRRVRELTGRVPAKVPYNEWLRSQSAEFQDDVLGPTRGRLFRKGGFTLDRFVNRAGDELTLAELATRDARAFVAAGLDPSAF